MEPRSSLLLKEDSLLDSKHDTVRKEESEKVVGNVPDVNADSIRNRTYSGNDT